MMARKLKQRRWLLGLVLVAMISLSIWPSWEYPFTQAVYSTRNDPRLFYQNGFPFNNTGISREGSGWREVRWGSSGPGTWLPHLCSHHHYSSRGLRSLTWSPPSHNTIFFIKTSCSNSLNTREACVVESAARHHPHRPVLILMAAPALNLTNPIIKVLSELKNVWWSWLDLDQVFSQQPLRTWHQTRQWLTVINKGIVSAMLSDAVRLELLRRYGGTYMDLDSLTLRPLPQDNNFLSRITDSLVSNGVMSFSPQHRLMHNAVADLTSSWDPSNYLSIGGDLLTRHLHLLCPENFTVPSSVPPYQAETCEDITVFPAHAFVPFSNNTDLQYIFIEGRHLGAEFIESNKAYTLHLFNHLTSQAFTSPHGDSVLKEAAELNCPHVMKLVRKYNLIL